MKHMNSSFNTRKERATGIAMQRQKKEAITHAHLLPYWKQQGVDSQKDSFKY
jgi:hypothetical protein